MSDYVKLERLIDLEIQRGMTYFLNVDLSLVDFQGGVVKFTVEDKLGNILKEADLSLQGINQIIFPDEFTATMNSDIYYYGLALHVDNERIPLCLRSYIYMLPSVGGYKE